MGHRHPESRNLRSTRPHQCTHPSLRLELRQRISLQFIPYTLRPGTGWTSAKVPDEVHEVRCSSVCRPCGTAHLLRHISRLLQQCRRGILLVRWSHDLRPHCHLYRYAMDLHWLAQSETGTRSDGLHITVHRTPQPLRSILCDCDWLSDDAVHRLRYICSMVDSRIRYKLFWARLRRRDVLVVEDCQEDEVCQA